MPKSPVGITELQSKVWNGSLTLEIRLSPSDCRTFEESKPYLIQYPRLSYLAFLLPRLHAFFLPSLVDPDLSVHDAWLSFQGVPLKWHYPLGLLYDLFAGAEPAGFDEQHEVGSLDVAADSTAALTSTIPWRLTIHYTDFPFDQLIALDAEGKTIQDTYVNSVKEADFVRNGTARTFMSLSKDDSDDLWRAVQERKLHGDHHSD
jgi:autophagy-related protein 5